MAGEDLFAKEVILSNGEIVPRSTATQVLLVLDGLLSSAVPGDRHLVFCLREACLGREWPEHTDKARLQGLGHLEANGSVNADVKAVVLAAIRGEGSSLSIVSPFTTRWDRILSDLARSRYLVRLRLPEDTAELLIASDDLGQAGTIEELRQWANKVRPRKGDSWRDLPPPSWN